MTVSSALSSGVGIIGTIALLIVSLTIVRKADERAGWLLAGGFAIFLGLAIAWPIASFLISRFVDDFSVGWAAVTILFALVRLGGLALEVFGLVVLAQACVRAKEATAS